MGEPFMIGIAGGSASGKSTLVNTIAKTVADGRVAILRQDWYYRDQSDKEIEERARTNYDHPDAFDNDLLVEHVEALMRGETVYCPTWDYVNHVRAKATVKVEPRRVVIVEGILVLEDDQLRDTMDLKIFVDTDPDIRLIRRIQRDTTVRGRTFESVTEQYLRDVRPMHEKYVEPCKAKADLVIPHGGYNSVVIQILTTLIDRHSPEV